MFFEDFSVFEKERFYRPFSGKLYKTIPWHTNICPYKCGFCCADQIRKHIINDFDMDFALDNLEYQIQLHKPEFIHITSESFLSMNQKDFDKFVDVYSKYCIPFWCQSHINDIKEERIKVMNDLNCFKIGLGIECGNKEYRKVIVNKHYSNDRANKSVKIISESDIRIGLNSIIGFPFETKSLINDTINLNKRC